jgi:tetratricopeptide (TPR) repeat protein
VTGDRYKEFTEILLDGYSPDIVFTHWPIDFNMDHRACSASISPSAPSPEFSDDTALQQAEKEFQAALAENPGDAGAEYRLGRVCAQRLDFKSAIEHYSRALELRPDHVYAQIGMGEALMNTDKPEEALEHLLAASRLDPLNATVHYRLSVLYREMGRDADAHRELAIFRKLQESKKSIQHVYQQMHELVPGQRTSAASDIPSPVDHPLCLLEAVNHQVARFLRLPAR